MKSKVSGKEICRFAPTNGLKLGVKGNTGLNHKTIIKTFKPNYLVCYFCVSCVKELFFRFRFSWKNISITVIFSNELFNAQKFIVISNSGVLKFFSTRTPKKCLEVAGTLCHFYIFYVNLEILQKNYKRLSWHFMPHFLKTLNHFKKILVEEQKKVICRY